MNSEPQMIQRPRKWPRHLGIILGLLVVLYFVVTSSPFLRSVVLPQVESAIGSKLDVGDLSLSPFSQLELRNVKITPKGAEPLAQIDLIRLRYSLWSLLRGNIQAHEITVEKPVITLVEHVDGSRNLPKLPPSGPKSTAPLVLDLHQIQLRNGSLNYTVRGAKGPVSTLTVGNLNVSLDQVITAQPGKLTVQGEAAMEQFPADKIAGKLSGEFTVTLGRDAMPTLVKGSLGVDLGVATGAFRDASGLRVALESDVSPNEVKDLRLAFRRAGQELARLRLSGPYDAAKPEARLDFELSGVDRQVLVLLGGATGFELGETSITAKGKLNLLKNGEIAASNGELTVHKLSLGTAAGRTPVTEFTAQYKVEANLKDNAALLEELKISATDGQGQWLSGSLDRPMNVAWGSAPPGFRESRFTLKLARLQLAEWHALLGSNAPAGSLRADLTVSSERDGRLLKYDLKAVATQLSTSVGTSQFRDGTFEFSGNGSVTDFNVFALAQSTFAIKQGATPLTAGTAVVDWQVKAESGGLQVNAEGELPPLLGLFPVPGVQAESGRFKASVQANQSPSRSTANLSLNLENFNGRIQESRFADYRASVKLGGTRIADVVSIPSLTLSAGNGTSPGGTIDASGKWDTSKKNGEIDYHISSLNQSALEPWLAPLLLPNRLQSVNIDASGKGRINLGADTAIISNLKIRNLKALTPTGQALGPLDLGLDMDAVGNGYKLDLKRAAVLLGATAQARNELVISGSVDLATNNPSPSALTVRSDGLDLNPLYQLFAGDPNAKATTPAGAPAPARPEVEPGPISLPLSRLTADIDISKVFLGTLVAENWKGHLEIDRSVITIKPFGLSLNGSPVTFNALANVGIPGWQYDWAFKAPNMDVAPFVATFRPDYKGKLSGHLSAEAAFKGAGLTGINLQKNLSGTFDVHSTNLNIDLAGLQDVRQRQAATLASKPKAGVLSLIGQAFGGLGAAAAPGWYEEISRSPINTVIFRGEAGGGKLVLKDGLIRSPVLQARPTGNLTFANSLSNSPLNFPVALALRGAVARQFGLSQDTNAYASLPQILTIVGTYGKPDPKLDHLVLAGLLAKSSLGGAVGGLLNQVTGGKAGAVTDRISSALESLTGTIKSTNNAATNAVPRKTSPLDLLNDLTQPRTQPAKAAPKK